MPDPVEDALEIVEYVLAWRLPPARWSAIEELLGELAAATDTDDDAGMRRCLVELRVLGPVRITRLGATPVTPAPPVVRERVDRLVHALRGAPPDRRAEQRRSGEERG